VIRPKWSTRIDSIWCSNLIENGLRYTPGAGTISVAVELVKAMHGTVRIGSDPWEPTRFIVDLPA